MKRRTVWPAFALAWVAVALSPPASAETLREAVEQAVRTNPELQVFAKRRFAADEGVKQAQGGYWPRLDLTAGTGRERLDSAESRLLAANDSTFTRRDSALTLSQMLLDRKSVV